MASKPPVVAALLPRASLLLGACAFLVASPDLVGAQDSDILRTQWTRLPPSGQALINLIADEHDGSVFVSTVSGSILKYSSQKLDLVGVTNLSTVAPNQRDAENKILAFVGQDHLLSCWQASPESTFLTCALFGSDDITLKPISLVSAKTNRTLSLNLETNATVQALSDNSHLLLAASRPKAAGKQLERVMHHDNFTSSDSNTVYNLPALARFELAKDLKTLNLSAMLSYRVELYAYNPLYEYTYMFHHQEHTFFVLNDIQRNVMQNDHQPSAAHTGHTARLARVCRNDTQLTSYTELLLTCKGHSDDLYAKVACLNGQDGPPTLDIIYERLSRDGSGKLHKQPPVNSYLCSYSMDLVRAKFDQAIGACHAGNPNATLLAKLQRRGGSNDLSDLNCRRNELNDYCTSNSVNSYIDGDGGRHDLIEDAALELAGLSGANFLLTTSGNNSQQNDSTRVHFIGTESGLLTKITSKGEPLYTLDLHERRVVNYRPKRRASVWRRRYVAPKSPQILFSNETGQRASVRAKYAFARGIITALSGRLLHQVPIDSCQFYTSCGPCYNALDPLECLWCDDVCANTCSPDRPAPKKCDDADQVVAGSQDRRENSQGRLLQVLTMLSPVLVLSLLVYLARYDGIGRLRRKFGPSRDVKNEKPGIASDDDPSTPRGELSPLAGECASERQDPAAEETRESSSESYATTSTTARDRLSSLASHSPSLLAAQPTDGLLSALARLNERNMSSDYFSLSGAGTDQGDFLDEDLVLALVQDKILIDRGRLSLGHVLGAGEFGRVYKGFLREDSKESENSESSQTHREVAVKTLHARSHWDDTPDNRAFLREGLMMRDFEHENVLALIGVTFDTINGLPMVITPFMKHGDLKTFISDESNQVTYRELIEFGVHIAQGMAYLSSLKFVHRDLAARNCMLDENRVAKVADFGLSRDIYNSDYYASCDNRKARRLPVRWMALECLEKSLYTTKSDVWSYGVLLWELMMRDCAPYPNVDNYDLLDYLKRGHRMRRPPYCPELLYDIMRACWHESPDERPSFSELVQSVSSVITQLLAAKDIGGGS